MTKKKVITNLIGPRNLFPSPQTRRQVSAHGEHLTMQALVYFTFINVDLLSSVILSLNRKVQIACFSVIL